MRSLEESRKRWQITTKHSASLDGLKKSVRSDGKESPCNAGLRSVCWKTFLLFQTIDVTGWSRTLADSRSAYSSLREHLLRFIEYPDELGSALDPLDDDRHSPWNTLRQDEEIRAEIFQDIERCMPEEPYFRETETQRIMLDVLFVFCKINQDVGYRQGMHELLAPILWAIKEDAINYLDINAPRKDPESLLEQVLDPSYIEHDAFTLFSLLMRTAKSFYELGESPATTESEQPTIGYQQQSVSPIVERSKRIHEVYLARLDPALAKHLTDIEVLPQIFLIRWIRLLFGREFPFDELLELWDFILAEDPGLELVDMVCVAMLLRIRWELIEANYSVALMLLLKYPAPLAPHGPQTFVEDAIFLRDNYSATGGAKIISRYSGKAPLIQSLDSRPATPLGQAFSPRMSLSRNMSPIPSPARFLQQQGGVEALLRGAAKGVFDRGEKLGINQAVRDAAVEVKKNMQGLQTPRSTSVSRQVSGQWSLDEGRSIVSSKVSMAAMSYRNQQLARMLDMAVLDLRLASVSREAMDIACAKVDFVRVYLEDSTLPLPPDESIDVPESSPSLPTLSVPQTPHEALLDPDTSPIVRAVGADIVPGIIVPEALPLPDVSPTIGAEDEITKSPRTRSPRIAVHRPRAPVPTRSTIANSSFSWMLEPETSSSPVPSSSPTTSSSPFLKSGRKPTSGHGRDKAAYLFGDDGGESKMHHTRPPLLPDIDEGFKLTPIKASVAK